MAKRFTDTELWDKEWFMLLSAELKCLVKFVRDKCDLSGVWSPNWVAAKMYIGVTVCEENLLAIDSGNQFQKLKNGKILCVDFIKFQYGTLSQKSPVHRKVISILEGHNLNYDTLLIGYKYPINRVQEKEEEKDKDKEEDKEEEKEVKTSKKSISIKTFVRENISLTDREIEMLQMRFSGEEIQSMFDILSNYKFSSGKTYKSDYHTLLGWVKDKIEKEQKVAPKSKTEELLTVVQQAKQYFENGSSSNNQQSA